MNDILDITKRFIQLLKQKGIKVSDAYLFGSYAMGNPKEWSDIDVCVVSPDFGKDYFDEMVKMNIIAHDIDSRIETHPFALHDLEDPYDTLSSEVRKHGIKIDVA